MNKKIIIGLAVFLVVLFGFIFILNKQKLPDNQKLQEIPGEISSPSFSIQTELINSQAYFAIYTNGGLRVFTGAMYHRLSPDAYIEVINPNVVHIKKLEITWNDFFKTLPFSLTKTCLTTGTKETYCTNQNKTLKFYLNGVRDDDLLNKEIKDGDRALITYGNDSDKKIQEQINRLNAL